MELSNGEYGLREVLLELIQKYGKGQPVSEETFFDDLAAMTFPEIREFFDDFVLSEGILPHSEYLEKIGLEIMTDESDRTRIVRVENPSEEQDKLFEAWSKRL